LSDDEKDLVTGPDGKARCFWGASPDDPVMQAYHDDEWGRPVTEDALLFERISLEGFQSGLSWRTILLRREGFRRAFAGFDIAKVARFTPARIEKLVLDASIIRHRGKIESTVNNARRAIALIEEVGSLAAYTARFRPEPRPAPRTRAEIRATSPESIALSKDLKKRGFSFVGPTTMYAHMQAAGLVNDHLEGCHARAPVERAQKGRSVPSTRSSRASGR